MASRRFRGQRTNNNKGIVSTSRKDRNKGIQETNQSDQGGLVNRFDALQSQPEEIMETDTTELNQGTQNRVDIVSTREMGEIEVTMLKGSDQQPIESDTEGNMGFTEGGGRKAAQNQSICTTPLTNRGDSKNVRGSQNTGHSGSKDMGRWASRGGMSSKQGGRGNQGRGNFSTAMAQQVAKVYQKHFGEQSRHEKVADTGQNNNMTRTRGSYVKDTGQNSNSTSLNARQNLSAQEGTTIHTSQ